MKAVWSWSPAHWLGCALLFLLLGCDSGGDLVQVDPSDRRTSPTPQTEEVIKPLRISVGAMITPKAGFAYYRRLLDYLGEHLDRPVEFIDRKTYAETNLMLANGEVDVAFVCGRPYIDGHEAFGLELLVAPQVAGKSVYHSYIIVHRDSDIQTLDQLRNRRFAFTDPDSNSGALAPTYILSQRGATPQDYFSDMLYTFGHDKSIEAVALGVVDGAAVDSLIWEYAQRFDPKFSSMTRVVHRSDPYGIPPVTVPPSLDPQLKAQLRTLFLNMHLDPDGKEIIHHMGIERFVPIEDAAYDSIRSMKRSLRSL